MCSECKGPALSQWKGRGSAEDWAPDGQSPAVTHIVSDKCWLENPIGKVLYENTAKITQPHVSHAQGNLIPGASQRYFA